jgi:hypothetical protein
MKNDEWLGKIYARRFDLPAFYVTNLATRSELSLRVFDRLPA